MLKRKKILQHCYPPLPSQIPDARGCGCWGAYSSLQEELLLENLYFSNNLILDYQDFSEMDPDGYPSNRGRSLYIYSADEADSITVRNAHFINERLPNHAPETSTIGGQSVGNTFYIKAKLGLGTLTLENIELRDCDDGGLYIDSHAENETLRNFEIVNVNRMGLNFEAWEAHAGIHEISNGWIHGVHEQDMYLQYPYTWTYQHPVAIYGDGNRIKVNQLSVTACSSTVFTLTEATWNNSLFYNNSFDYLLSLNNTQFDPTFYFCVTPEDLPGSNNLLNLEPGFDGSLPFLSANSPLIDAGHPDFSYFDRSDPDHPGFALWPSQGGLRNDIGYTGGPHARALNESVGIAVPETGREALPATLELKPAYPNPFNPVTQNPFVLRQATHIRLQVYNLRGQRVRTLVNADLRAGEHHTEFRAGELASGVYIVQLESPHERDQQKILLIK